MSVPQIMEVLLTQHDIAELSRRTGIAMQTLRNWRRGISEPAFSSLVAVIQAAGFNLKLEVSL